MVKAVEYNFYGQTVWLFYSVGAMLEVSEKHGDVTELIQKMDVTSAEGRDIVISAFCLLARAGASCARHFSEAESYEPSETEVRECSTLKDLAAMRDAVISAVCLGVGRDVPDANGVDLDLMEFEKENNQKKTR